MSVPVSTKGKAHKRTSGGPSTGAAMGHSGPIKFGGKTYKGVKGQRPYGSESLDAAAVPPQWTAGGIPDQTDAVGDQPLSLAVGPYLVKDPFVTTFSLVTPPAGFTIDSMTGKISVSGAIAAAHSVTVRATNPHGFTDDTFTWTITA